MFQFRGLCFSAVRLKSHSDHLSNRMQLWTLPTETYKSEIAIRSPSRPRVTSPAAREGAMDEPKTFFQRAPNSLKSGDINLVWMHMTLQECDGVCAGAAAAPEKIWKKQFGSRISARTCNDMWVWPFLDEWILRGRIAWLSNISTPASSWHVLTLPFHFETRNCLQKPYLLSESFWCLQILAELKWNSISNSSKRTNNHNSLNWKTCWKRIWKGWPWHALTETNITLLITWTWWDKWKVIRALVTSYSKVSACMVCGQADSWKANPGQVAGSSWWPSQSGLSRPCCQAKRKWTHEFTLALSCHDYFLHRQVEIREWWTEQIW